MRAVKTGVLCRINFCVWASVTPALASMVAYVALRGDGRAPDGGPVAPGCAAPVRMHKSRRVGSETDAVVGLCAVYERVLGVRFVAGCKPDRAVPGNPHPAKAPDCLVWTEDGVRLAIEHKRFMTMRDQAKIESEFARVREGLVLPEGTLGVFHLLVHLRGRTVPRDLRSDLQSALSTVVPTVATDRRVQIVLGATRLELSVWREGTADGNRLFIQTTGPSRPGGSIQDEAARLEQTLGRAMEKFDATPGARRAVVLHSDDFINIGQDAVENWLKEALTPRIRAGLDDVWWLDTYPGVPVVHFFTAWWSCKGDAVASVFSAEWTAEAGDRAEIMEWAPGRPWWRSSPSG